MEASTLFIIISIVVIAAIAALWFFQIRPHGPKPLSPLSGIAFAFVIAGIVFGDDPRWLGYGLFAIGIAVAIADMIVHRPGQNG